MRRILILLLSVALTFSASAQEELQYVHVRVVDVGQGLYCIVSMPDGHFMVYDAGSNEISDSRSKTDEARIYAEQMQALNPDHDPIDLLVLSHAHSDHVNGVDDLLRSPANYNLRAVLRTGMETSKIRDLLRNEGCDQTNLKTRRNSSRSHGTRIPLMGERYPVTLTMLCGWGGPQVGDDKNSTSIVVRLEFADRSILFAGDAVHQNEEYLVEKDKYDDDLHSIDSDVLIAPHHGARDSNSDDFIEAVSPTYVVFSAGRGYNHPHDEAVRRYLENEESPVPEENLFFTDRGDDEDLENKADQWDYPVDDEGGDKIGDDSVDIWICSDGTIFVDYATDGVCPCAQ